MRYPVTHLNSSMRSAVFSRAGGGGLGLFLYSTLANRILTAVLKILSHVPVLIMYRFCTCTGTGTCTSTSMTGFFNTKLVYRVLYCTSTILGTHMLDHNPFSRRETTKAKRHSKERRFLTFYIFSISFTQIQLAKVILRHI